MWDDPKRHRKVNECPPPNRAIDTTVIPDAIDQIFDPISRCLDICIYPQDQALYNTTTGVQAMPLTNRDVAESIMQRIDDRLGGKHLNNDWQRERYVDICRMVIGEIEISMNSVKEEL